MSRSLARSLVKRRKFSPCLSISGWRAVLLLLRLQYSKATGNENNNRPATLPFDCNAIHISINVDRRQNQYRTICVHLLLLLVISRPHTDNKQLTSCACPLGQRTFKRPHNIELDRSLHLTQPTNQILILIGLLPPPEIEYPISRPPAARVWPEASGVRISLYEEDIFS